MTDSSDEIDLYWRKKIIEYEAIENDDNWK